ncbi:hypothetical protein [Pontibacter virosus]|uniref:Uncharacterized protein n=1 Tax=Pontibacter virosus TaxID=1765052 RepID=A0A2U1AWZ3_9BACT|nr:hypothetical protein [Pontibacter virosus]PVY40912.1 hypothetical protein C8E01_106254 [Pontibacter virosus]
MLTDISWSHFFLTAGTVLVLYYLTVLLLFYRHDIKHQLSQTFLRAGLPAPRPSPSQESILGAAFPEAAPSLSSASDLLVAPAEAAPPQTLSTLKADLLTELDSLLESAAEMGLDKAAFLSLLHLLDERHMHTADEKLAVQRYLLEQGPAKLSFPLTATDLAAAETDLPHPA